MDDNGSWWGVQVVILYAQVVGSNIIVVFRVSLSHHHRYWLLELVQKTVTFVTCSQVSKFRGFHQPQQRELSNAGCAGATLGTQNLN